MNHSQLIDTLIPVAWAAGEEIMKIHQRGAGFQEKTDGSPVTEADTASEQIILNALAQLQDAVPVVSEENKSSHDMTKLRRFFLVDPLDGTKEFLKQDGKGAFTVNVALIENGNPVLGIVYAPALGRLFFGDLAGGAFEQDENGKHPIQIRRIPKSGPVAVASTSHRDEKTDQWLAENNISQTISIGSSLKFCLLACGEADVYPRFGPTMEWDTAAGHAVLKAAGGRVEHPDGQSFEYGKPNYKNGSFIAYGAFGT